MPILPEGCIHEPGTGPRGRGAHGYMGHKNNICAQEISGADIFNNVVIIADENATFPAKKVEDAVPVTWRQVRIYEWV